MIPLPLIVALAAAPTPDAPPDGAAEALPRVRIDAEGKVQRTSLSRWLLRDPGLPTLEPQTERLALGPSDEAAVQALLSAASPDASPFPWRATSLPHVVPLAAPPERASAHWLVTLFEADAMARRQPLALWCDAGSVPVEIFVNGTLMGLVERGTSGRGWPGRLGMPGALIDGSVLRADGPNVVAVRIDARDARAVLREAFIDAPDTLTAQLFWTDDLYRYFGTSATLAFGAVACIYFTLAILRGGDARHVSFGLGCMGFALTTWLSYWHTWPLRGLMHTRLACASVPLACAHVLFLQLCYGQRAGWLGRRRLAAVLAGTGAAAALLPSALIVNLWPAFAALAAVAMGGATFISLAAMRRGRREAVMVLVGLVGLAAGAGMTALRSLGTAAHPFAPLCTGMFVYAAAAVGTQRLLHVSAVRTGSEEVRRAEDKQRTQAHLMDEIGNIAAQIETISRMVVREAREGQRGSVEQSSAVAQTRSAMQSLLATGRNIMQAAQEVLHNAELTHRNNDLVAERIADLAGHARRIIEILEAIRAVANKSDLLALNAALQGLRAGSAGRGFTVVATQMQQLAERIMAAVADIQELTGVIREASLITEASNTEAARLASHTTLSARQISAFIAEQQSGTEQVSQAMEDIADVAQNAAQVGNLTLEGVQNLLQHADHLRAIASAFGGSNDLAALSHLEGQDAYVDGDDPPERPGPPGTGRGGHDAEHKERK